MSWSQDLPSGDQDRVLEDIDVSESLTRLPPEITQQVFVALRKPDVLETLFMLSRVRQATFLDRRYR